MRCLLIIPVICLIARLARPVESLNNMLFSSNSAKCFQLDLDQDMTLTLQYYCPDIRLASDPPESEIDQARQQRKEMKLDPKTEDINSRFNDRFSKKLEEMKKEVLKNKDVNILIFQRELHSVGSNDGGTQKIRHQVTEREGALVFETGTGHGLVDVCVQSYMASYREPSRVQLNMTVVPSNRTTVESSSSSTFVKNVLSKADLAAKAQEQRQLTRQTSAISNELLGMQRKMQQIASMADTSKEREVNFHNKSISLGKAVRYWPIVRIIILFIAGYMQVSSVIRFMKSKHIY